MDQGTAEVSMKGDYLIEVYCHGGLIDTTFMLNYYMHNDSAYVCLKGDEHFGGFDMHHGTFTYSIRMMDESEPYYMKFTGSKEQ